jgi:hypothetical protein
MISDHKSAAPRDDHQVGVLRFSQFPQAPTLAVIMKSVDDGRLHDHGKKMFLWRPSPLENP